VIELDDLPESLHTAVAARPAGSAPLPSRSRDPPAPLSVAAPSVGPQAPGAAARAATLAEAQDQTERALITRQLSLRSYSPSPRRPTWASAA
jgi:hypothetical protein